MDYRNPKTLLDAAAKQKPMMTETGTLENINVSGIITKLIQETGRFAERFASDVLYNFDEMKERMTPRYVDTDERHVVAFGIRRNGVDDNAFVMSRLTSDCYDRFSGYVHQDRTYRKLYVVEIGIEPTKNGRTYVKCELKDLTDAFIRIDVSDMPDELKPKEA